MSRLSAFGLALALMSAVVVTMAASSPNEQLPAGPMQEKAAAACLSCHEARILVQQRLSKAAWTREVDKMVKWGAEVDPADRDALIDYFSSNFGPDQPPYVAPKSAGASATKSKTKAKH
ncbi:MAG: cytochrome c [Terriglobales bacterium]